MARLFAASALVFALAGCDWSGGIEVRATVTPEAQQAVWLQPIEPDPELRCGPLAGAGREMDASRTPPPGAPTGVGVAFAGGGSCPKMSEIAITVDAPAP